MSSSQTFPEHDGSSFFDYLLRRRPDLMPTSRDRNGDAGPLLDLNRPHHIPPPAHGTTVLAIKYGNGVVIAGDRRATEGFQIAGRQMEKVFKIDGYSAMAIAGTAGPAIEMVKLFQTELEHYEKLEGVQLSYEGKANKLGQMVKANLPMVFHGLIVIPIYVATITVETKAESSNTILPVGGMRNQSIMRSGQAEKMLATRCASTTVKVYQKMTH